MLRERTTTFRRDLTAGVLNLLLVSDGKVKHVEVDHVFSSPPHEVFHTPKNSHVTRLRHVGGVGNKDQQRDVVPPYEPNEVRHHVALEPVEDEDGAVVNGAKPSTKLDLTSFYLLDEKSHSHSPKTSLLMNELSVVLNSRLSVV